MKINLPNRFLQKLQRRYCFKGQAASSNKTQLFTKLFPRAANLI